MGDMCHQVMGQLTGLSGHMIGWLPGHCNAATLGQEALDGAVIATPVRQAAYPDADRVRWQPYNGQPRGSDLIRMAPWFDDGSLGVHIARSHGARRPTSA